MKTHVTRRGFAAGAAAFTLAMRRVSAAAPAMRQFHNQTADSPLHKRLVQMWEAVGRETDGAVRVEVFAQDGGIKGSDPEALGLLRDGGLEFFTLMGGILGEVVPVADAQGIPFAFRDKGQAYAAVDGDLGDVLRRECAAKGIYAVRGGCFENGFRHITSATHPVRQVADLQGVKMRTPNAAMFTDAFKALGCDPVVINVADLYGGLKEKRAEAQENPLIIVETFKLYEVQRYVSLTSHMWSGFNLLANLQRWKALPEAARMVIEKNAAKFTALQRADNTAINLALQDGLVKRGMLVNTADTVPFRAPLSAFYARWKAHVGTQAWTILENRVGKLG